MKSSALILMLCSVIGITSITVFFFVKVLLAKPKENGDDENENEE